MAVSVPGPLAASPSGYWVSASFPAAGKSRFIPSLAVDQSGSRIYVSHSLIGNPGNVTVQDPSTGAVQATIPGTMGTAGVVLSHDGARLYIANSGITGRPRNPGTAGVIQVVDTRSNAVTASIETDQGAAHLALSPDGRALYGTMYQGHNVAFIDTASNAITAKVPVPGYRGSVAVSPDGSTLYIADAVSVAIFVVSVGEKAVVETIETGLGALCGALDGLVLNPSGTQLFVTGCATPEGVNPTGLIILDTATRAQHAVPLDGHAADVAFSPDGRKAYVTVSGGYGHVSVIDTSTRSVAATFPVGEAPQGVVATGDGSALFIVHAGSEVSRVDLTGNGRQAFADVPAGAPFFHEVSWLGNSRISTGYPDGSFRPLESVQRDAMAAFLFRKAGSPASFVPPAVSPFRDLSPGDMFYKEITWLASQGITTGYDDGTFRPRTAVSREAMAAFLYRYATVLAGAPTYTAPSTAPFSDVRPGDAFHREVSWAAAAGITTGYPDGSYRPGAPVSREAMAAFLYRLTNPDKPMPR
ncbi:hypothetical protein FCN77_02170 [Arthrobacter sp. 24S4-2]|nr:hypothetical protein FCN77_02170 [Arthrobacter sp. 24S4-2]